MKGVMSKRRETSAEMALLCACIRPDGAGALPAGIVLSRPVDWPRFLALATNHHVIPLVTRALAAAGKNPAGGIPPEFLDCFRRDSKTIAAHNLRATAILRRLQEYLGSSGIQLIPIKGPALALWAYGSTSLRQFEDLDLVVEERDLLRAVERLEQAGYVLREIPPDANRDRYLATKQDWSLHKPGEHLHLDLKPVLISHALCGPRSAGFLATACRSMPAGDGGTLQAPGPEAMMLAVCVDGANEMWPKLSAVADVAALFAARPGADWTGLLESAAEWGQGRSLLVGAGLAESLLDCRLPAAFRSGLERDPAACHLADAAAKRIRSEVSLQTGIVRQSLFAFQTRERFRDRCRFAVRLLFVPGAMDLKVFSLPDAWYPLYSCLRPIRLARTACCGRSRRGFCAGGGRKE